MLTSSMADASDKCNWDQIPWSLTATSAPNATLATVLAGFMMSVMAILLGREGPGELRDIKIAHTLALFGSGVLILGLDAFLFGNISALVGPKGCAIAWTEAMPATSMLMVGACLMVAGLAWVLAQYFVSQGIWDEKFDRKVRAPGEPKLKWSTKWILRLPGILTGAVIVTTAPLVILTVLMYINVMDTQFQRQISFFGFRRGPLFLFLLVYVITISWIISHKTRLLIEYIDALLIKSSNGQGRRGEHGRTEQSLELEEPEELEDKDPVKLNSDFGLLAGTFVSAVALAVVGALFAGFVGEHGPLVHADATPGDFWIYFGIVLALVPTLIPILIALAVPSAPEDWAPPRSRAMRLFYWLTGWGRRSLPGAGKTESRNPRAATAVSAHENKTGRGGGI
ncbi:hypothetical protein [Mycobacterium sp. E796]|uniref:hypothetical protein n=1 Tax=Mycobacterium sp. E796 TaxID=1834151 RepID=UPI0012EA6939|nr:hypothetical protein [Mycobacterium sp. E796]